MSTRVALVDDQVLVRTGFRMVLEESPNVEVVGEAADGYQALRMIAQCRPDVTLMDVRMPNLDGIETTRRLVARNRDERILVLTTFDLDEYAFAALQAGASGFLLKDITADELLRAIQTLAIGDAVVAPRITRRLLDRFAVRLVEPAQPVELASLTPKEREVFLLVAGGLSNAEIAATLVVSETTVKSHVGSILAKLQLPNRVHAVIYAYEHRLIDPAADQNEFRP